MHAEAIKKTLDLAQISTHLRSLLAEGRTDEAIEMVIAMLSQLQTSNIELVLKLMKMERERSGRRSERMDPEQISLMLEMIADEMTEESDHAATEGEDKALAAEREALQAPEVRQAPRRRRPSKDLPREIITHELAPEERLCSCCGRPMTRIGEDVSEIVELIPAQFQVQEHRQAKYACSRCKETVVTAAGPAKLIEKGLPGPGLLAHVVVSKHEQHLPLTRLVEIYRRGGFTTSTSTLCGWVSAVADELAPIVDRIFTKAMVSLELQTDGSGLKVLDRDDPEGICKGTIWTFVGDRRHVVFRYSKDGTGGEGPWRYLKGREGYLQADASNIFDRAYNGKIAEADEVGCLSHARRKYYDLVDSDVRVAYPLKLIGQVYQVEDLADRRKLTPEERLALREARSAPIMDRYHRWLLRMVSGEPPASQLAKACAYSLNHWAALTRFLTDGHLAPDNNLCEQQIRCLALGRRNYLFAGSDAGAERIAILYSVIRTCALHGIDAFAYLKDTLSKLAVGWPTDQLDELLPENWSPATPKSSPEA
ncbi:MAG: IS66 family transposase [Planctomycetes bacterium]|nr:IS66 family transposase [Planctomycetota bacterium]